MLVKMIINYSWFDNGKYLQTSWNMCICTIVTVRLQMVKIEKTIAPCSFWLLLFLETFIYRYNYLFISQIQTTCTLNTNIKCSRVLKSYKKGSFLLENKPDMLGNIIEIMNANNYCFYDIKTTICSFYHWGRTLITWPLMITWHLLQNI